jgi:hypothetical protein
MIKNATGEIANKIQSVGMSLTECQNIVKIPKINATVESKRMPENESLERFEPYPKTFLRNIKKTKTIAPTAANESYKKEGIKWAICLYHNVSFGSFKALFKYVFDNLFSQILFFNSRIASSVLSLFEPYAYCAHTPIH